MSLLAIQPMPGGLGVHPICFHTVTAFVTLLREKHLGEPGRRGRWWHGQGHQAPPPEPPSQVMLPAQGKVFCHQPLLGSTAELWQTICCPQQWWWQRVRGNPQVSWCLSTSWAGSRALSLVLGKDTPLPRSFASNHIQSCAKQNTSPLDVLAISPFCQEL